MRSIPKIIHYCWFGENPIPALELRCIESWRKFLPDYKLMFWNEDTFDISSSRFAAQAYEAKMYAFVSDYVRVWALNQYGGLYLDTDMELLMDIDDIVSSFSVVFGFENQTFIGTALMAAIPEHPIMTEFLDFYASKEFIDKNGNANIVANPTIIASFINNYGITLNGQEQEFNGVKVFDREVFYPKKISETDFRVTSVTKSIHYFNASWLSERQKKRGMNKFWIEVCRPILRGCNKMLAKMAGENFAKKMEIKVRNFLR